MRLRLHPASCGAAGMAASSDRRAIAPPPLAAAATAPLSERLTLQSQIWGKEEVAPRAGWKFCAAMEPPISHSTRHNKSWQPLFPC